MEGERASEAKAATVMRKEVPVCAVDDRLRDLDRGKGVAVVVDGNRVVVGLLRAKELAADGDSLVEDVMVCGPSTFRPDVPIEEMADYMTKHDLDSSPITTSDGRLAGVLFRDDAVRASRR